MFILMWVPVFLQTQAPVTHILICQLTFRFYSWVSQLASLAGKWGTAFKSFPCRLYDDQNILIKARSQCSSHVFPYPQAWTALSMLPWSWLFYCRSSYKVGCKTALTFLVSFLHTSYVRRVIRITEKNKVLIHTLHVPTAECTASGSEFCGRKKRQSPRSSCALANRGATLVFLFVCFVFKINSGVFILCCVLLNLWWLAQNT